MSSTFRHTQRHSTYSQKRNQHVFPRVDPVHQEATVRRLPRQVRVEAERDLEHQVGIDKVDYPRFPRRNSLANVVVPAPFGPATTIQRGLGPGICLDRVAWYSQYKLPGSQLPRRLFVLSTLRDHAELRKDGDKILLAHWFCNECIHA